MNNLIKSIAVASIAAFMSLSVMAQVTPAQIEQFKKLPKSQQQSLAKSMGVDLNSLGLGSMSGGSATPNVNTPVQPRAVESASKSTAEEEIIEQDLDTSGLKAFGYDVFANGPSTFAPLTDIAIPEHYVLGTGDIISVQIFGKENFDYELPITREGSIVIPNLGPFKIAGLSFSEMKAFLKARISERIIGVDAIISLASLRSMRVFVLGEAYKPGPYTLSSLSSITHAIFAAGGINDIGSLRKIQLKRSGKLVTTFDLYDLLINGDSSNDVLLQSGDVVFVAPVGSTVKVEGKVRRPAIYEVAENETYKDVIKMAGGTLPSAYLQSVMIERYSDNSYLTAIDLDLTDNKDLATKVKAGDHIRVKKTTDQYEESVTLIGALTRPGKYQWKSGQRISDVIPRIDSHLLTHADLNYALVVREIDIARNIEVLQFSLAKALSHTNSKDNIELKPNDKLVVFSSVSTLKEEKITLDNLAYTQEELFKLEKKLAKNQFQTDQFWRKYGAASKYEVADEESEIAEYTNQSIARMTAEDLDKASVKELSLFSRQRLLMPIVEKLRRQGVSGSPLQLVEVDGQVKFPGVYPLAKNARIDDLVIAAGGISESAYMEKAELTRNQIEGIEVRKVSRNIDLASALDDDVDANLLLQSKDRLNIHKIPSWSENHVVELRGEVVFPGSYTIRRGDTLSELIKKAGGLTEFAHAEGAVFSRTKLKELEKKNLEKLTNDLRLEMASKSLTENGVGVSYAEAQSLLQDLNDIEPVGRLVIELPKVIGQTDYDIQLEGGDVLVIPSFKNSINVIGQVQVTSSHMFDPMLDANDYIEQSGGMKKRADDNRVYIIGANGRIRMMNKGWFAGASTLQPGDTVVVPLDAEYMNNLTLWSTATQIIYNTAVAVAALSAI